MGNMVDVIKAVAELEKKIFADAWSEDSIKDSLSRDYNKLLVAYIDDVGELISSDDIGVVDITGGSNAKTLPDMNVCDRVVGYVLYSMVADESELFRIAVSTEYRGMGCGSLLLKRYIELISESAKTSFLEVRKGNEAAKQLYEKFKYKKIANRKQYYSNPIEDALIYELRLP